MQINNVEPTMNMRLLVVGEFGEVEKDLGIVANKDILTLCKKAEVHELSCLSFIDLLSDTYFNSYQLEELQRELAVLQQVPDLSADLLAKIQDGVENTLAHDGWTYLKFESTNSAVG